jgi:hypothetical protein
VASQEETTTAGAAAIADGVVVVAVDGAGDEDNRSGNNTRLRSHPIHLRSKTTDSPSQLLGRFRNRRPLSVATIL